MMIKAGQVWLCNQDMTITKIIKFLNDKLEGKISDKLLESIISGIKYMSNNHIQRKTRPVIIVSNNQSNMFSPNVNIIPITSARKKPRGVYQLQYFWKNSKDPQTLLCEQITTIPKDHLLRYLYSLEPGIYDELKMAIKVQLNLNYKEGENMSGSL